ncbi:hypothetical protein [Paraflavitalea speifideaquila]|uniref:hypothetical protein n=1 Tax=Paraflavitalea speifideaquila TaxID=3076558 RepID=UPI0028EF9CA1|nr:hypothetical protein [Paraflavitalea speifideiaquila]
MDTQQYSNHLPGITIETLLTAYREHVPNIQLNTDAAVFLERLSALSIPAGLITDGRSITQRNKLKALQLNPISTMSSSPKSLGPKNPMKRITATSAINIPVMSFIISAIILPRILSPLPAWVGSRLACSTEAPISIPSHLPASHGHPASLPHLMKYN